MVLEGRGSLCRRVLGSRPIALSPAARPIILEILNHRMGWTADIQEHTNAFTEQIATVIALSTLQRVDFVASPVLTADFVVEFLQKEHLWNALPKLKYGVHGFDWLPSHHLAGILVLC